MGDRTGSSTGRLPFYDDPMAASNTRSLDELLELMTAQRAASRLERETRQKPKLNKSKLETARLEAKRKGRIARWESNLVYTAPPSVVKNRKHKHTDCCKLACTNTYEEQPEALLVLRKYFQALPETGRTEFISRRVRDVPGKPGVNSSRSTAKKEYHLETPNFLCNRPLRTQLASSEDTARLGCKASFLWLLGVSSDKVTQPTNPSPGFSTVSGHGLRHLNCGMSEKTEKAVQWLRDLASYYQHCPKSSLIFLPFAKREVVYDLYLVDMIDEQRGMAEEDREVVSKKWFLELWREREELAHIKLRRWLKFALCDHCVSFRTRREEVGTLNKQLLIEIKQDEQKHVIFVKKERVSYMLRRAEAENPLTRGDVFSLILDAADQAEYGLPYFKCVSHSTQAKWRVKSHLMAGIAHGRQVYGFSFLDNCKHGANINIESMWRICEDTLKREGRLPRKFYLQLDNTSKQCKNRFLLGWLACLVQWGVFDEVVVSFLPVGHTHEDIDQIFSRLAMYLRHHDSRSRIEMMDGFASSYKSKMGTRPITAHIEAVANISHWLETYLASMEPSGDQKGISNFYQFKLYKQDREARMQVREWCNNDDVWTGLNPWKPFHAVFKRIPTIDDLATVPPAQRKKKKDHTEERQTRIRKDVESVIAARSVPNAHVQDLR